MPNQHRPSATDARTRQLLAHNLKTLRKRRNLRQADMAAHLDVTRSAYASWEERRAQPKVAPLLRACACFSVTLDALLTTKLKR